MKSQNIFAIASLVCASFIFGCVTPPEYPKEPFIEFISLSKDTMLRGISVDQAFVTFSFTDGDGDIGSRDSLDLYLTDNRDGTVLRNRIPFVPELGSTNGIKGEITVKINSTCCIFPDPFLNGCEDVLPSFPYDQVRYSIYITDRAKNKSNVLEVDPIFVRCF